MAGTRSGLNKSEKNSRKRTVEEKLKEKKTLRKSGESHARYNSEG